MHIKRSCSHARNPGRTRVQQLAHRRPTLPPGLQNVRNPASAACRQGPNFVGRKGSREKSKRKKKRKEREKGKKEKRKRKGGKREKKGKEKKKKEKKRKKRKKK